MIEYELSVNIQAENKEAIESLLITVESVNSSRVDINAVELLSISGLSLVNKQQVLVNEYEQDSWLSPLRLEKEP